MGREVRRVPPNWEHPKKQYAYGYDYVSKFKESYREATEKWDAEFALWVNGQHEDQHTFDSCKGKTSKKSFIDWYGERPEDPDDYMPEVDMHTAWFQAFQTVSEGTPVSPPFATQCELIAYLAKYGEFNGTGNYTEEQAARFVLNEFSPTFVYIDGKLLKGTEV